MQSQAGSVPVTVPEPAAELHQLRARVAELEFEREEMRKKRTRSFLSAFARHAGGAHWHEGDRAYHSLRSRCFEPAKYGLRGVRVGEAKNPGLSQS